jgi:hypothetical protein
MNLKPCAPTRITQALNTAAVILNYFFSDGQPNACSLIFEPAMQALIAVTQYQCPG